MYIYNFYNYTREKNKIPPIRYISFFYLRIYEKFTKQPVTLSPQAVKKRV
mgnify:CR=1 FL=1